MLCPRCGRNITDKKWGDTGPIPSIHILVKKCTCSPNLISEREIVDGTIKRFRKQLDFNKKVHHVWPDSIDLLLRESGCTVSMVRSRLVHFDLW